MAAPPAAAPAAGSPPSNPESPNSSGKQSYSSMALQYMYNAKAAVSNALRKDLKNVIAPTEPINCLGATSKGEDWLMGRCRNIQYFSYRNRLPQIIGNNLDHDAGWGCMVRTGQMMLCCALHRTVMLMDKAQRGGDGVIGGGKDNLSTSAFHEGSNQREASAGGGGGGGGDGGTSAAAGSSSGNSSNINFNAAGMKIPGDSLRAQMDSMTNMFRDLPQAEFSIYGIVSGGARYTIAPGEWFTATSLGLCLQHLINSKQDKVPLSAVHCRESTVELHEVEAAIAKGKPVLIMVSVMLGMSNIDKGYYKAVHEVLGCPSSVGIVGGKPKKSMYFFASHRETLFMLDPHYVQPAFVDNKTLGQNSGVMDFVAMAEADSSMLLCFLLEPSTVALDEWVTWAEHKLPQLSEYPIFAISRRKSKSKASSGSKAAQQQQQHQQQHQEQQKGKAAAAAAAAAGDGFECIDLSDDDFAVGDLPSDAGSAAARFHQDSLGDAGAVGGGNKSANLASQSSNFLPPVANDNSKQAPAAAGSKNNGSDPLADTFAGLGGSTAKSSDAGGITFDDDDDDLLGDPHAAPPAAAPPQKASADSDIDL